jgi:hypothetical protein
MTNRDPRLPDLSILNRAQDERHRAYVQYLNADSRAACGADPIDIETREQYSRILERQDRIIETQSVLLDQDYANLREEMGASQMRKICDHPEILREGVSEEEYRCSGCKRKLKYSQK